MEKHPYKIDGPAIISFSGGRTSGFMLRQIIDAHGGSIHAENLPQRGTAFHIVLPSRVGSSGERYADSTI